MCLNFVIQAASTWCIYYYLKIYEKHTRKSITKQGNFIIIFKIRWPRFQRDGKQVASKMQRCTKKCGVEKKTCLLNIREKIKIEQTFSKQMIRIVKYSLRITENVALFGYYRYNKNYQRCQRGSAIYSLFLWSHKRI